jgi:adenine-specific DNA-methyltransferase
MKQVTTQKANGAHFTPSKLARFVAKRIINSIPAEFFNARETIRVLDPSCGDGELLLAFAEMLPPEHLRKIALIGIESDEQSLAIAKQRLMQSAVESFELEKADFLELCKGRGRLVQPGLFDEAPVSNALSNPVDIIIANPPYVRTQVIGAEKAQVLAEIFGLSGRVDLYQAFLVAMTHILSKNGFLGVITSNRFLSTKGGSSIRALLSVNYDILELIDLGDTRLFEAAVLPAIFVGKKASSFLKESTHTSSAQQTDQAKKRKFIRIYEQTKRSESNPSNLKYCDSVYSVLETASDGIYSVNGQHFKVTTGIISLPSSPSELWSMVTLEEQAWLDQIHAHTKFRISDLVKVRVGIKTTADEVFIRNDWDSLPENMRIEEELLHLLVSQNDAERWALKKDRSSLRRILYTHKMKNGKRVAIDLQDYPECATYFEKYRDRLSSRKYVIEAKRRWYEIWVPQNPELWTQPKLIFPDISPDPRFYYDDRGYLVDGNCYWIILDTNQYPDLLFLIAGIANSRIMACYHDLVFNNKLYAGRRRYLTQYVEKYPLPDPEAPQSREIVALVKDLVFSPVSNDEILHKERELEKLVAQAFGVVSPLEFTEAIFDACVSRWRNIYMQHETVMIV